MTLRPRVDLVGIKEGETGATSDVREMKEAELMKLANTLGELEEPLIALERRGISLARMAARHANENGLLPRYRISQGTVDHWFTTKADVEAFMEEHAKESGRGQSG